MEGVKIGDKLAFDTGYGLGSRQTRWAIYEVTKITPSGRIVCGPYTLDPNLSIRGRKGYGGPYRGKVVTQEILDSVKASKLIGLIDRVKFRELSLETLRKVWGAIEEGK